MPHSSRYCLLPLLFSRERISCSGMDHSFLQVFIHLVLPSAVLWLEVPGDYCWWVPATGT